MTTVLEARNPAEICDEAFVPALFRHWGPIVAAEADVGPGARVLDVACGTGALTVAVLERVGGEGSVVGLEANPEMLAMARRKPGPVEWVEGRAEALPFPEHEFDAVVSQFGMMFFADPVEAVREKMRVLRPGGRTAVAVCDAVENSPGYAAFAGLLDRLFGRAIGDAFRAPFVLGDPEKLLALAAAAGILDARVERRSKDVRFASIRAMVSTERACVWTLGGVLDEDQFERLQAEAETALAPFVHGEGGITFAMPALILTAERPLPRT